MAPVTNRKILTVARVVIAAISIRPISTWKRTRIRTFKCKSKGLLVYCLQSNLDIIWGELMLVAQTVRDGH